MKLYISKGNTKLGNIPNLNLPPGISCRHDARCLVEGCYAQKAYRLYPSVRNAWNSNAAYYTTKPHLFFNGWSTWLYKNKPAYFRIHSAGDIPNQRYLIRLKWLAKLHPDTKFLCFTKRYRYDYSHIPTNLKIVLSVWPSMKLPNNIHKLPMAWLKEDPRRDKDALYLMCPGHCEKCNKKCWNSINYEVHVIFPKH